MRSIPPSNRSKVKSSVQRGLRQKLLETYPGFEPFIEEIMPKKASLEAVKLYVISFITRHGTGIFHFITGVNRYRERSRLVNPATLPQKLTLASFFHSPERTTLYTIDSTPLFFQPFDGPPIPHLRLIHAFPTALPTVQIDRGAIRFVLSGAALMAPGLTSPGGRLPDTEHAVDAGQVVAVKAEGKEQACLVGTLKVSTEEIKSKGKGVVIDEGHYLGDGLWRMQLD